MSLYKNTKPNKSGGSDTASLPASIRPTKQSTWFAKLYPKQKRAVEFVLSRPATALFCKPGVGKTYISLAVLEKLKWHLVLIVAPLTSLDVTWAPKLITLNDTRVHRKLNAIAVTRGNTRQIVLTNPEALRRSLKRIVKYPWDLVIWDESQNIKSRSSVNSRLARRLRHVPRRLALSGTPIDTGQIDIWAQMRFVDYEVLGEHWKDFANEYCYKSGWMNKEWVFSPKMNDRFLEVLKPYIFRLDNDFLGLKPIQVIPVPTMMLGRQRRIYDNMLANSIIGLDGCHVVGNNTAARDVKLSQITGGAVLDEEGAVHHTGRAKARKLTHLLKRMARPVVIFCQFLHEIEIIRRIVPDASIIQGATKLHDRTRIIDNFQAGKIDTLICQVRVAGESISLTRSCTLILYSMTYSYINFEQVIHRLQRGGQTQQVSVYVIFCVSSIDEDKLDLVKDKGKTSYEVLAHFEE